ncbi:MAG: hypothetical protein IPH04_19360 [Saprospirales bacterium]|nr:hypothetical protein [Saprospirales bacterium]
MARRKKQEEHKESHINGRYAILAALLGGLFTIFGIWYSTHLEGRQPAQAPVKKPDIEAWLNQLDENRPDLADSILQYLDPGISVISFEQGVAFEEGRLDHFLNTRMIDPGAKTIQIVNKEEMSKSPDALEIMYK